jgi:methylmalonyl-CoA mutase
MAKKKFQQLLSGSFPKTNKSDWTRIATVELNGSEPFKELAWKANDDLEYLPYYDSQDSSAFNSLRQIDLLPDASQLYGNRKWLNQPPLKVNDPKVANELALLYLQSGADGLLFQLDNAVDIASLLKDIQTAHCELSFAVDVQRSILDNLEKFVNTTKCRLSGILIWEDVPVLGNIPDCLFNATGFRPLGIHVKTTTTVEEITQALLSGVKCFDQLNDDHDTEMLSQKIAFSFNADNSFLLQIAKLRAFRFLWSRVLAAYGVRSHDPYIHSSCLPYTNPLLEPNVNMLGNVNAAMSSVLGGCAALSVYPSDYSNKTLQRIAKNVSNILREESHFNKVADPVAGTYVVDAMVQEMSDRAWSSFLKKVSA